MQYFETAQEIFRAMSADKRDPPTYWILWRNCSDTTLKVLGSADDVWNVIAANSTLPVEALDHAKSTCQVRSCVSMDPGGPPPSDL